MKKHQLIIEGMTCGHCVHAARKELGTIPGVTIDDVQIGTASITIDDGLVTRQAIEAALDRAGFTLKEMR